MFKVSDYPFSNQILSTRKGVRFFKTYLKDNGENRRKTITISPSGWVIRNGWIVWTFSNFEPTEDIYIEYGNLSELDLKIVNAFPVTKLSETAILNYMLWGNDFNTKITLSKKIFRWFPRSPKAPWILFQLARGYYVAGEIQKAIDIHLRIIQSYTNFKLQHGPLRFDKITVLLELANCYAALKNFSEAEKVYRKIITYYPLIKFDAYFGLTRMYKKSKNHEKAISTYQEILRDCDKTNCSNVCYNGWMGLADLYEGLNKKKLAIQQYEQIIVACKKKGTSEDHFRKKINELKE